MKQESLETALKAHKVWLNKRVGTPAYLHNKRLIGMDFKGHNLRGANLSYCKLGNANLSKCEFSTCDMNNANLEFANLTYANLNSANLIAANLSNADLRNAELAFSNLNETKLEKANLGRACLWGCTGNGKEIKSIIISAKYPVTYTAQVMQIGCENHPIAQWWAFTDEEIQGMDVGALEWWKEYKDTLKMIIERHPAVPTGWEYE